MTATIYPLDRSFYPWRWALRCAYNPALVADLKTHIHCRQRRWVAKRNEWWFRDEVIEVVVILIERNSVRVQHKETNP